jgi:hypothetical protein
MKSVPLDSDTVMTARELGMCLGDEVPVSLAQADSAATT